MKSVERRLIKRGFLTTYNTEIAAMVERGASMKLEPNEIYLYDGPVHYIPHHGVVKPESKSTPLRIVYNSSASYMNHVLNEYWAKGPDVINSLIRVLLGFRKGQYAVIGDISKMYNCIKLSNQDQHTHRFLWRDGDVDRSPDHYVLLCVPFGDKPSGAIATIALRNTADMSEEKYPKEAEIIKRDSYVDDVLFSEDVDEELLQHCKGIETILKKGGFQIKHWTTSLKLHNEQCLQEFNISQTNCERVLGMLWDPILDKFKFKMKINFSQKCQRSTLKMI